MNLAPKLPGANRIYWRGQLFFVLSVCTKSTLFRFSSLRFSFKTAAILSVKVKNLALSCQAQQDSEACFISFFSICSPHLHFSPSGFWFRLQVKKTIVLARFTDNPSFVHHFSRVRTTCYIKLNIILPYLYLCFLRE